MYDPGEMFRKIQNNQIIDRVMSDYIFIFFKGKEISLCIIIISK